MSYARLLECLTGETDCDECCNLKYNWSWDTVYAPTEQEQWQFSFDITVFMMVVFILVWYLYETMRSKSMAQNIDLNAVSTNGQLR